MPDRTWDDKGTGIELPAFLDVFYTNRELVFELLAEDKGAIEKSRLREPKLFRVAKDGDKPSLVYMPNPDEELCSHGIPKRLDCRGCRRTAPESDSPTESI